MKRLNELFDCSYDTEITDVSINSKEIKRGDLFVCIKGISADRHDFIDEAVKRGANALVVDRPGNYDIPFVLIKNTNDELGNICKKFYDNPLDKIKLIGITGTDGKTTTATIIKDMLGNDKCGYIGTNGVEWGNKKISENNTTPEINKTYKYLNMFSKDNFKYASMEISSESLLHNRTNTLELDVVIITNITEDHLNVHKNIENYIESKEKIFSLLKSDGIAILNRDDKYFERLSKKTNNKILTYGKSISSDLVIIDIKEYFTGTIFTFSYKDKIYKVISPLIGEFNVYNLCASILTLTHFNYTIEEILERITLIANISGRCEILDTNTNYKIILDYAHTANALKNILIYLNKVKKNRIITVTGSAGGREKEKRKDMGDVVLKLSDLVIFTMDDPRYENVDSIIDDMINNSSKTNYKRIIDRKEAIKYALSIAKKDDIILVAGKGRDNYMAIEDKYLEYNDYDVIQECLNIL